VETPERNKAKKTELYIPWFNEKKSLPSYDYDLKDCVEVKVLHNLCLLLSKEQKLWQIQSYGTHAGYALLEIQDAVCSGILEKHELIDKLMDALTMLASANKALNQHRRDTIRPELD